MNKVIRSIVLATAVLSTSSIAFSPAYAQDGQQEKPGEEKPKGDGG